MQINKLFWQKLVIAFIVGFASAFITAVSGLGDEPNFQWTTSVLISLVVGGLAAGARAVLALGPVNLVPSDGQHSVVQPKN